MCLVYGSFSPRFCFPEITLKSRKKHTSKHQRSQSFIQNTHLSLWPSQALVVLSYFCQIVPPSHRPRGRVTLTVSRCSSVFKATAPWLLLAPPAASLLVCPVSPLAFPSLMAWYLFTYQGEAEPGLLMFGQMSIPQPCVLVNL